MNKEFLSFNIDSFKEAINSAFEAVRSIFSTQDEIDNALRECENINEDFSDFLTVSSSMKQELEDIKSIPYILNEILSDAIASDEELIKVLNSRGTDTFIDVLSNLISNGNVSVTHTSLVLLPNMVRDNVISISDLSKIVSSLYSNSYISNTDLGVILYELKRTNYRYTVDKRLEDRSMIELNNLYGYHFTYDIFSYNDHSADYFKIKSDYDFKLSDINTILLPMFESGLINEDDLNEIITPLHVFQKRVSSPEIYNNPCYNPTVKEYKYNDEIHFGLSVGNRSYSVTEEDIFLIKQIHGYKDQMTGNEVYDNIFAVVCISDFVLALHTKEIGSFKHSIDEALAVGSVLINRCEDASFSVNYGGIVGQLIGGVGVDLRANVNETVQYETYCSAAGKEPVSGKHDTGYLQYINGCTYNTVEVGIKDSLNGIRNHDYNSFRVSQISTFTPGGNSFHTSTDRSNGITFIGEMYRRVGNEEGAVYALPTNTPYSGYDFDFVFPYENSVSYVQGSPLTIPIELVN